MDVPPIAVGVEDIHRVLRVQYFLLRGEEACVRIQPVVEVGFIPAVL